MGGMRALEWAVTEPERVERLLLLACPAAASADQIAWARPQLAAIRDDPGWHGGDYHDAAAGQGPHVGPRRRPPDRAPDLPQRRRAGRPASAAPPQHGEDPGDGGRYAVESYLDHHAEKLVHRFDAGSLRRLTAAMNAHDVGRGRGGVAAGPGPDHRADPRRRRRRPTGSTRCTSRRSWPTASRRRTLQVIESPYGHDGFLIEADTVSRLLGGLLGA